MNQIRDVKAPQPKGKGALVRRSLAYSHFLGIGLGLCLSSFVGWQLLGAWNANVGRVEAQEAPVAETIPLSLSRIFVVNVPAIFRELVTMAALEIEGESVFGGETTFEGEVEFQNDTVFDGQITLNGNAFGDGVNIDVGSGEITASNVIYSLEAGSGISISDGQNPTVSATDLGSAQSIFKKVKVGSDTAEADENGDTLEFAAGSGISLSIDTGSDKLTITNSSLPGFVKSGTYAVLESGVTRVGIGTSTPGSTVEITSESAGTSGLLFTNLTSASSVGVGGGKVLSVDSGGNVILVTDESGGVQSGDLDSALPGASTGSTIYFDGSSWAHTTNLYHNGGQVGISAIPGTNIRFDVSTNSTTATGMVIRRVSSQTANLLELRNESDGVLSYFDADGVFNGSIAGGVNPNLTTGSVVFQGPSGLTQDNANFFWDDTNNRLGIGTSSPAYRLDVVGNTQINSANTLAFNVVNGATPLFSVMGVGNVGIGTTTPGSTLPNLWNNTTGSKLLQISSEDTNTDSGLFLRRSDNATGLDFWSDNGNGKAYIDSRYNNNAGSINFRMKTAGTPVDVMTILATGNVGIGTTSPTSKLHVSGAVTGKALAIFDETGNQDIFTASASGVPRFVIQNDGDVGIGTAAPAYNLHVVNASGDAKQGIFLDQETNFNGTFLFGSKAIEAAATRQFTLGINSSILRMTYYGQEFRIKTNSAHPLTFHTNNSERVRIDPTGLVGIGTTNPGAKLDIFGDLFAPTATFSANYAAGVPLTVRGGPSGTGNLTNWQNSAGTALANINAGGSFSTTGNIQAGATSAFEARLASYAGASSALVSLFKGSAGQTHSLTEWQNSSGTVLTAVTAAGAIQSTVNVNHSLGGTSIGANTLAVKTNQAGNTGLIVRGVTSQTANLLELQAVGGVGLSAFDASGNLGIGTTSPTYKLDVISTSAGANLFRAVRSGTSRGVTITSEGITAFGDDSNTTSSHVSINSTLTRTTSSGLQGVALNMASNITQASGSDRNTALYINGTVDQSGGGTGITAGLRINPTLTSAADYRALELNNASGFGVYQSGASANNYFAGKVGIGSSSVPAGVNLYVIGSGAGAMRIDSTAESGVRLVSDSAGTPDSWFMLSSTTGTFVLQSDGTTNPFQIEKGTPTNTLYLDSTGNVGVGVADPTSKLTFADSTVASGGILFGTDTNLYRSAADMLRTDDSLTINGILQMNHQIRGLATGSGSTATLPSFSFNNDGNTGIFTPELEVIGFTTNGSEKVRIDSAGNVGIGALAFGTDAAKVIALAGSTAPSTAITDGIQLFAVDVAGSHELQVMDEAGNTTTLSPHNFSVIGGRSEDLAWSFYSERNSLAINADMTKALRIVEKLSGEKLIYLKDLATGQMLEDETDATKVTELADNGTIGEIAKWNYTIWTYIGEVIFEKPVQFLAGITVNGKAVFTADAWFGGRVTFADKDMAGFATITPGNSQVTVTFSTPFAQTPVITATPKSAVNLEWFRVTSESPTSFDIEIANQQSQDVVFSWTALAVEQPGTTSSVLQPEVSPAPTASPEVSPSPSPSSSPSASPVSTPISTSSATVVTSPDPVASSSATP